MSSALRFRESFTAESFKPRSRQITPHASNSVQKWKVKAGWERTKGRERKRSARAYAKHVYKSRLLLYTEICWIFSEDMSDLYNSTSVIAFKGAPRYFTSDLEKREKRLTHLCNFFGFLFCNLSPDIRKVSGNVVFVELKQKGREKERNDKANYLTFWHVQSGCVEMRVC